MKKWILLFLISFPIIANCQCEDISEPKSDVLKLLLVKDSFTKKEYHTIGKVAGVEFVNIYLTDIDNNKKTGLLRLGTPSASTMWAPITHSGIVEIEDIKSFIKTLNYIKTNVILSLPDREFEYLYTSNNHVRIGAYNTVGRFAKWALIIQPSIYKSDSIKNIDIKDIDKLIDLLSTSLKGLESFVN